MKVADYFEPLEPRPWIEVCVNSDEAREEIRRRGWEYDSHVRRLVLRLEFVQGRNRFSIERFVDPREPGYLLYHQLVHQRRLGVAALFEELKYRASSGA